MSKLTQEQKEILIRKFEKWVDKQPPHCPIEGENKVADFWLNIIDELLEKQRQEIRKFLDESSVWASEYIYTNKAMMLSKFDEKFKN